MQAKTAPKEMTINIKVRSVKGDKTIAVSNATQIETLKNAYLEALEISKEDIPLERLRFFCMGKEL